MTEKCREWRKDLWIVAVDFKKAFGTVFHSKLSDVLRDEGVPEVYVNFYEKFCSKQFGHVQFDVLSRIFEFKRGVKQGDPISPRFLNAILEDIFTHIKPKWEARNYGLQVDQLRPTNLRFADMTSCELGTP